MNEPGLKSGRIWKLIRRLWAGIGISATVIFAGWSLIAYRASPEARAAVQSDSIVSVKHENGVWFFRPNVLQSAGKPGLVFFPGALVSPVAYAPLARAAAAAGYESYIVELPRRGALGGAEAPELQDRLESLLKQPGMQKQWFAAGHSRGAVVATQVATENLAGFAGLILIGTSHPRDVDLSTLIVPVTKIVGTLDGLASQAEVEQNRHLLPSTTHWVWIEGGNHSQFGWHGFQPGDRFAKIPASAQHTLMTGAVLDALGSPL